MVKQFIGKGVNAMKVLILYFSSTGNTATIAKAIEEKFTEMGAEVTMSDITPYTARKGKIDLGPYQAVVFGSPIHSWRAPRVVREWMRTLDGQGKKCAMFFTFGGFQVHPSHYSTRKILEEQNFVVVSSAQFLGAHTFNLGGWKAMEGRPDAFDLEVAEEYAQVTYKRFTGEDDGILGELEKTEHTDEKLDAIETFRFNVLTQLPTRGGKECSMCMVCEELCPTGAMEAESGEADKGKCIACLACVANCPESVLKINDMSGSWPFKLEMEKCTEESLKGKKSKIYL
jgi:menaquinone-dependent protoporphyrinogen IX oxidase/ferredoxin